ncbi:MAG: glycosyltransferase family 2 protein [Planctomycetes bacterium]|nr:glycosyltransferase family 2 protein [Planctomycetota bacterium]
MNAKLPKYDIINECQKMGDTLVLIPVYNEMPQLADVMRTIRLCWDGDMLAVDDNSRDKSLEFLKLMDTISVIHNRSNAGAGGVLLQGFRYAYERGFKYVITLDADGQHSPFLIRDFIKAITPHCCGTCKCKKRSDFIWGSRYMNGYPKLSKSFLARQEINRFITQRLNEVTGYNLTDAFCGFRAYNLKALHQLEISETGYGMFMQMTIQAARAGISIKELPVPLIYLDDTRNFQGEFDNTRQRLDYYNSIIDGELAKAKCARKIKG